MSFLSLFGYYEWVWDSKLKVGRPSNTSKIIRQRHLKMGDWGVVNSPVVPGKKAGSSEYVSKKNDSPRLRSSRSQHEIISLTG